MARSVPAILPYTLLKKDDVPTLVFLLWRDRRASAVESSTFWGPVVCPLARDDNSALDAVCRGFSEKTKGQFAPAMMVFENEHDVDVVARKSPAKQKIEESRLNLRKKLRAGNGVTLLNVRQFITYVAPVRFVQPDQLAASFGADKGEVEWIAAEDLFAALYSDVPDNIVTIRAHPWDSPNEQASRSVLLPLALPFTVSMRTQEARSEIATILKQFNVPLPIETLAPAPAAAADAPDVASLSLHESKEGGAAAASASVAAAASSAPAAAAAAAPSAASAQPARTPSTNYSCRKCRLVLFTDLALSSHASASVSSNTSAGRFAGKYIKMSEGGRRVGMDCSSLFVDPHALEASTGVEYPEGEGPLQCPKCTTRYGNYVWSGAQCSCGEWVVPSFQVVKSKIDERPVAGRSTANHIAFSFQRPPPRVPATPPKLAAQQTETATPASADAAAPASASSGGDESKAQSTT